MILVVPKYVNAKRNFDELYELETAYQLMLDNQIISTQFKFKNKTIKHQNFTYDAQVQLALNFEQLLLAARDSQGNVFAAFHTHVF